MRSLHGDESPTESERITEARKADLRALFRRLGLARPRTRRECDLHNRAGLPPLAQVERERAEAARDPELTKKECKELMACCEAIEARMPRTTAERVFFAELEREVWEARVDDLEGDRQRLQNRLDCPSEQARQIALCLDQRTSEPASTSKAALDAVHASGNPRRPAGKSPECRVCRWTHEGDDINVYRDGDRRYTFKSWTRGAKLLQFIHDGMAKGAKDVDCSTFPNADDPYVGDLIDPLKSHRFRARHTDLLALVGNRRARIRRPEETCPAASPASSRRARRKTGD